MVPDVADKLGHVVQVELVPLRQAVGWVAWVTASDGYNQKVETLPLWPPWLQKVSLEGQFSSNKVTKKIPPYSTTASRSMSLE